MRRNTKLIPTIFATTVHSDDYGKAAREENNTTNITTLVQTKDISVKPLSDVFLMQYQINKMND